MAYFQGTSRTYPFIEYATFDHMRRSNSQRIGTLYFERKKLEEQFRLYNENPMQLPFNDDRLEQTIDIIATEISNLENRIRNIVNGLPREVFVAYYELTQEEQASYTTQQLRTKMIHDLMNDNVE